MREVIKIDIHSEPMMVPDEHDRLETQHLFFPLVPPWERKNEAYVPEPELRTEEYLIRSVRGFSTPYFPEKHFAVKTDEFGIFNQLLSFAANDILRIKTEEYKRGFEEGIMVGQHKGKLTGAMVEVERIRKVSWWKRLLNNF